MENENLNVLGYKQETIEKILNMLNTIPVTTYAETQTKMKIYEMLLKPEGNFEKKPEEDKNKNIMKE